MKKDLSRTMPNGYILDPNPNLEVNEIVDGIYISSQDVAHDLEILESNGITHIVNVATGIPNYFERNFKYLSIQALDNPNENLKKHFVKAVKFMRKAIEEGGRVLVHCNAGISRSTSIVIAYIIYYKNKRFQEAYEMVKKNHPATQPNLGFILQLKEFENELPLHS